MESTKNVSNGGIGFGGLLTIVFIVLKLTHNIDWSWWWVVSPIWIPLAFVMAIILVIGVVMFIRELCKKN